MALQGLTGGGVSGLNTVPAVRRAGEECNTEEEPVLTPRKSINLFG